MLSLLRNTLLLLLLTLSSFGSMVCVQPDGSSCTSPLLINVITAQVLDVCDDSECPDDLCPCNCEPEECQSDVIFMQSGLLASIQIPEKPIVQDLHVSLFNAAIIPPLDGLYISPALFTANQTATSSVDRFFFRDPVPQLHGRAPMLSTTVLRI